MVRVIGQRMRVQMGRGRYQGLFKWGCGRQSQPCLASQIRWDWASSGQHGHRLDVFQISQIPDLSNSTSTTTFFISVDSKFILPVAQAKHLEIILDFLQTVRKYWWHYFKMYPESRHNQIYITISTLPSSSLTSARPPNKSLCSYSYPSQSSFNIEARVFLLKGKLDQRFSAQNPLIVHISQVKAGVLKMAYNDLHDLAP